VYRAPLFGVLLNAHVIELIGAVVFADVLHEDRGLGSPAFGLLAGDTCFATGSVCGGFGRSNRGEGNVGRRGAGVCSGEKKAARFD